MENGSSTALTWAGSEICQIVLQGVKYLHNFHIEGSQWELENVQARHRSIP